MPNSTGATFVMSSPLETSRTLRRAASTSARMSSIRRRLSGLLAILTLILASQQLSLQTEANSSPTSSIFDGQQVNLAKLEQRLRASEASITTNTDQLIRQAFPHQPLSQEGLAFDPSQFKSVYEAIRAHPDLREFASLVDSKGVREIVSTDNIALTVFAPIDRSLGDLLAKSKSRSINLIDLAKHHIAQGFVMPNDDMKFPFRFQSFAGLESPLYLNKISSGATHSNGIYVNNAKVIASYLIQIDQDNYQTLHLIDEPLEFAYVNRRTQFRAHQQPKSSGQLSAQMGAASSAGRQASAGSSKQQFASVKRALQLDDLVTSEADELNEQTKAAILEFGERFGDLLANQAQVHLYRTRSLTAPNQQQPQQQQRLNLVNSRDQLQYERLAGKLLESDHLDASLRGKLYNLTESSGSFNTYFLPIREKSLEQLLDGSLDLQDLNLALQAHIIPDQVLFTRTMPLGQLHATGLNRAAQSNSAPLQVSLGLAKALPRGIMRANKLEASSDDEELSRQLLSSPLLVQAKCELNPEAGVSGSQQQGQTTRFRLGLTQSEILLANIPLANGVLHLISKPLVAQPASLLDYINDNNQRLSNFVQALGSQSGPYGRASPLGGPAVELNKFRELLVRDHRQLSFTFSGDQNRTLLAPSDEAFSRLRYDLRALIYGDESMTPSHWDPTYRQDLLRRLVERHIIPEQVITSGSIMRQSSREIGHTDSVASQNGQLMSFRMADENEIEVDCGSGSSARARLLHRDLTGSNGILHVIDQVLGEEQETVHSLLSSLVLSYSVQVKRNHQSGSSAQSDPSEELGELIEQALNQMSSNVDHVPMDGNSLQSFHSINQAGADSRRAAQESSPELAAISKTIGHYLDGLSPARRQLLASSVNVSFHLAKLVSRAEGADDWNEKFQQPERSFTYFVPNDLAWFKLQQRHPELYKPLAYFLSQQQQHQTNPAGEQQQALVVAGQQQVPSASSVPRSSESSHRLLQILERHLIGNKKLNSADLNSAEQHLQTLGASLRLVDNRNGDQLHSVERTLTTTTSSGQTGGVSAFAALHSIISGVSGQSSELQPHSILFNGQTGGAIKRALEFGSTQANILQAYETSNGFVYLIDNVLILPEDPDYIVQTSSTPASSSTMSSLLGGHNSLLLDLVQGIFSPSGNHMSTNTIMALIGTLIVAIVALTFVAMVLIVRRYRQNKSLNRHQQLESGLTSSSSANSGSTSTTKSL